MSTDSSEVRYSRCCHICGIENPLRRAFFIECGHIICFSCALQLADPYGNQKCPFCRKYTGFKELIEPVINCHSTIESIYMDEYANYFDVQWKVKQMERWRQDCSKSGMFVYSRLCRSCKAVNPSKRAGFSACGHIICHTCALQCQFKFGKSICTICDTRSSFKALFEDEESSDIESCAIVPTHELKSIQNIEVTKSEAIKKRSETKDWIFLTILILIFVLLIGAAIASKAQARIDRERCERESIAEALKICNGESTSEVELDELTTFKETLIIGEARDYVTEVSNDFYKYSACVIAGRTSSAEEEKALFRSAVEKYRKLSSKAKIELIEKSGFEQLKSHPMFINYYNEMLAELS